MNFQGISLFGIEGCIRYNKGTIQYSQNEMRGMVLKYGPRLKFRQSRYGHGIDVLVTHSPAWGIHDAEDPPHRGFKAFLNFLDWYHPRYMIHGHVHTWDRRKVVETRYSKTNIVNINPVMVLDVEPK